MTKRIVVLGGGTGGTLTANRLHRHYKVHRVDDQRVEIVVVDQDNHHVYQPALLFVPFGLTSRQEFVRPRTEQLHPDIEFVEDTINHVDTFRDTVVLDGGRELAYDVLVIATGATLAVDETEGLGGAGWNENVFTFYDLAGATALESALDSFEGGKLVVNVVDMPIKCPVAPLEFCFLADWYFTERGIRDKVEITYATPLDGAFTKPIASAALASLLEEKGIKLLTEFNTGTVVGTDTDGDGKRLIGYDGRELEFDLAVVVPLHNGAAYVGRSEGLGDELNFVPTDPHTLQSKVKENVFVIGDATDVLTSKAGSVTHFEGEVLVSNIERFLDHEPLDTSYDGHANCFIETGFGKALLIDFNYDTEPLPGHFPTAVGMPLLKESRFNHLGKLLFQWVYWHALLPGRDIPGVGADMPRHGKQRSNNEEAMV
ncbi:MAG: NAD(P)/FAD-dependent oxidoreductase [Actinobacteria bacterium]|nr:NAD(P)/FAD-dependent oxidoreductase [Actinomycetota bacterium]